MTRVAVLGNGSWGTAFSLVLADAGADGFSETSGLLGHGGMPDSTVATV